jgi:granule-bound starch synthase
MQRFRLFNVAALEALRALPFGPGENCVIVCNDWHTALLPVLLKDVYQPRGEYTNTKVALTIHNLSYQVGHGCGPSVHQLAGHAWHAVGCSLTP